jgi:hypothetical protein
VRQERDRTSRICRANYAAMDGLVRFLTDECCVESSAGSGASAA